MTLTQEEYEKYLKAHEELTKMTKENKKELLMQAIRGMTIKRKKEDNSTK